MREIDISQKVKKIIAWGIPALIVIAVAAASLVWYIGYGSGDITVKDARVASSMVDARVRVAGTVSEILVKDGDQVKAGDVIARIKVNVTDEELKQLQQTVELSQRNLEQIKKGVTVQTPRVVSQASSGASSAEVERARSRMERMNQLYEMGAVSAKKRDEAAAEYQALAASASSTQSSVAYDTTVQAASPETIKKAEQQVRQAQAALDRAKGTAGATEITAPIDGTVYLGDIQAGTEVKAGQVVASIGNAQEIWVEAYPTDAQLADIRLGQAADFYVDRVKYHGLVLEVKQVEIESQDHQNAIVVDTMINVRNQEGQGEEQAEAQESHEEGAGEAAQAPQAADQTAVPSTRTVVKISISPEDIDKIQLGQPAEVRFLKKG